MGEQAAQHPRAPESLALYRRIVGGDTFFVMAVVFGAYSTFGVFFKPVLDEFGRTRAVTSGAYSLSWIVRGLAGIVMGRLTDRLGP